MDVGLKKRIITDLDSTILSVKNKDSIKLINISTAYIHEAGIYQDKDSVSLAIINYALAKVMQREQYKKICIDKRVYLGIIKELKDMKFYLQKDRIERFRNSNKRIISLISKVDNKLRIYIDEIFEKARIKKGSMIYDQGISLARASEILGVSQWELLNYVGKMNVDETPTKERVKQRLEFTRRIFGL